MIRMSAHAVQRLLRQSGTVVTQRALYGGYRSTWEQQYALHLAALQADGEIVSWSYETLKLTLAYRTTYTPDFLVTMEDGTQELQEVKGYRRQAGLVKLKIAAHTYPQYRFRLVTKGKRGEWILTDVAK